MATRCASVLVLLLAGCYSYSPLTTQPRPDQHVSLQLTRAGSDTLLPLLGIGVRAVEGFVIQTTQAGYQMTVSGVSGAGDFHTEWRGERVEIPLHLVRDIQERRFSLGRSVLLAGAAVGASLGAVAAFAGTSEGVTVGGSGGATTQ
jgi:hypothetical protein